MLVDDRFAMLGSRRHARQFEKSMSAASRRWEVTMKRMMLGLAAAGCLVTALGAQGTDPKPTCTMCPGTYIPVDELQAYTKKAIAEKRVDQQVRDIEIGRPISASAWCIAASSMRRRRIRSPSTIW